MSTGPRIASLRGRPRRLLLALAGTPLVILLIGAWELAVGTGFMQYDMLPTPSRIIGEFTGIIGSVEGRAAIGQTVVAVLFGWTLALGAGVLVGAAVTQSRTLWTWTMASMESLRPVPVIAFVPVALLLFGFSGATDVVVVLWGAFWLILINSVAGFRSANALRLDAADNLGLTSTAIFFKVKLPAAAPSLLVGARLGLALGLGLAVVTEMLGNPVGLGYQIVQAQQALQPEVMFAYVGIVSALGVLGNWVLTAALRSVSPAVRLSIDG